MQPLAEASRPRTKGCHSLSTMPTSATSAGPGSDVAVRRYARPSCQRAPGIHRARFGEIYFWRSGRASDRLQDRFGDIFHPFSANGLPQRLVEFHPKLTSVCRVRPEVGKSAEECEKFDPELLRGLWLDLLKF